MAVASTYVGSGHPLELPSYFLNGWHGTIGLLASYGGVAMNRVWQQFEKLALMPEFFRALAKEWYNVIFGETLVGVTFLLWWALLSPSNAQLIVVFIFALFFAAYYSWRTVRIRLDPKLTISRLRIQEWQALLEAGVPGAGQPARAFYFEVVNLSEATTIEDVSVQLSTILPEVPNLNWLPVYLHLKHDSPAAATTYVHTFDLHPHEPRNVDLVSSIEGDNGFTILHTVDTANKFAFYDTEGQELEVIITAKDMPILRQWFRVWRDDTGLLQCQMVPCND